MPATRSKSPLTVIISPAFTSVDEIVLSPYENEMGFLTKQAAPFFISDKFCSEMSGKSDDSHCPSNPAICKVSPGKSEREISIPGDLPSVLDISNSYFKADTESMPSAALNSSTLSGESPVISFVTEQSPRRCFGTLAEASNNPEKLYKAIKTVILIISDNTVIIVLPLFRFMFIRA